MGSLLARQVPLSDTESRADTKFGNVMETLRGNDAITKKLLFLGAGSSGKSTIFRQLRMINGKSFSQQEIESFKNIIRSNCVANTTKLLRMCRKYKIELPDKENTQRAMEAVKTANATHEYEETLGEFITALWETPELKECYKHRVEFNLVENIEYFIEKANEIYALDYTPEEEDIVRCRAKTSGIIEMSFEFSGASFLIVDVGGQRNERKKWIHCFENVTCVIFVASLSEYNEVLVEDESTSRMEETFTLFDQILSNKFLAKLPVILFLNKVDVFRAKLAAYPITTFFKDYSGDANDEKACIDFIKLKFVEKANRAKRTLYTHVTCAVQADNVVFTFNAVKSIIIDKNVAANLE